MKRLLFAAALVGSAGCWSFDDDFKACQASAHCAPMVSAAGSICTDDHWCWDTKRPHNALRGVVATSATDAWAFGDIGNRVHFDGANWTYVTGLRDDLRNAVAFGPNEIALATSGGVERWDGTRWQRTLEGKAVIAIAGTAKNDLWAAMAPSDEIRHYDGSTWTVSHPAGSGVLHAITAVSPTDIWAVGDTGLILHFDGSAWSPENATVATNLFAVWGSSPDDVWAAGVGAAVLHRVAGAWIDVHNPQAYDLTGASGTSSSNVWFVGDQGSGLHWVGTAFEDANIEPPGIGISVTADAFWTVGRAGSIASRMGTNSIPVKDGTYSSLGAVHGLSATDVWAVGDNGVSMHFDGTGWLEGSTGAQTPLKAVFAVSSDEVWAAGDDGEVRHRKGGAWVQASTQSLGLTAVWASGPKDVWFAGFGGVLLRYDGTSTTRITIAEAGIFRAISGTGSDDLWLSTNDGVVWHGPATWTSTLADPAGNAITALVALGKNDVWAASSDGRLLHWTGGTDWVPVGSGIKPGNGLTGLSDDHNGGVWAVGDQGFATRCKGSTCTVTDTGARPWLHGVFAPTSGLAFAVGDDGVQLRFQP